MKKLIYRSSKPKNTDEQNALLKSVYWYSPKEIRSMFYSIIGCTLLSSFVLFAKTHFLLPLIVLSPCYICLILSIFHYAQWKKSNNYTSGYFIVLLGSISFCSFLFSLGIMIILYGVTLSDIHKILIVAAAYMLLLIYAMVTIHFNMVNFVKDSLLTVAPEQNNGKNPMVFWGGLLGVLVGGVLVRAGFAVLGALFGIYIGIVLIGKLVAPRFSTYVNLDMLCSLKTELEAETLKDENRRNEGGSRERPT